MWRTMESAPRDGTPILGWCIHSDEALFEDKEKGILSLYGAHVEGFPQVPNGAHVLVWGGGWDDRTYEDPSGGFLSDWWFLDDNMFETPANPVLWQPIEPPDLNAIPNAQEKGIHKENP